MDPLMKVHWKSNIEIYLLNISLKSVPLKLLSLQTVETVSTVQRIESLIFQPGFVQCAQLTNSWIQKLIFVSKK